MQNSGPIIRESLFRVRDWIRSDSRIIQKRITLSYNICEIRKHFRIGTRKSLFYRSKEFLRVQKRFRTRIGSLIGPA